MKILLDECVTKKFKNRLHEFEVYTVFEMGWSGLKNGHLMKEAIKNSFDILLTIDKNLEYQQNLNKYEISLVIFDVSKSKIEYLDELLPKFKQEIKNLERSKVYKIVK